MKPKTVMFFAQGNTAVFDSAGEQIAELQVPWILEWVKSLPDDVDPLEIIFDMPSTAKVRLFKKEDGDYNWEYA